MAYETGKDLDEEQTTETGDTSSTSSTSTVVPSANENYLNYLNYNNQTAGYQQALNTLTDQYKTSRQNLIAQSNQNQLAQNEQLAAQGLAKAYNQNPNSGYSESSRIALDVALQNNLASLGQEQRDTINTLTQAMTQSQAYADAYLNAFNTEKNLNTLQNKIASGSAITSEEANSYLQQTGLDVYETLFKDGNYNTLLSSMLATPEQVLGNITSNELSTILSQMSLNDILSQSEKIKTLLNTYGLENTALSNTLDAINYGKVGDKQFKTNDESIDFIKNIYSSMNGDVLSDNGYALEYYLTLGAITGELDTDNIQLIKEVFSLTDEQEDKMQQQVFDDIVSKVNSGEATESDKQIYDDYNLAIASRINTDDDGNKSLSATKVYADNNGRSFNEMSSKIAGRDITIEINDKKYFVELESDEIDNSDNNEIGTIIRDGDELYIKCDSNTYKLLGNREVGKHTYKKADSYSGLLKDTIDKDLL